MWTSLKRQEKLQKYKAFPFLLQLFWRPKHYLLVRCPYQRLESFFKDKLRKHVDDSKTWQSSQKIFFPMLGLHSNDDPKAIQRALRAISFEQFIRALPKLYQKNNHLHPQHWLAYPLGRKLPYRLTFEQILKMEEKSDIETLSKLIDADFSRPENHTKDIQGEIQWTPELRGIAYAIYQEDFELYHYKP